jgi:hypothetical protein
VRTKILAALVISPIVGVAAGFPVCRRLLAADAPGEPPPARVLVEARAARLAHGGNEARRAWA